MKDYRIERPVCEEDDAIHWLEDKSFWDLDGCDRRDIEKELYRCYYNLKGNSYLKNLDIKRLMLERLEELEFKSD
ncbi:MAG: hypothetical protein HQK54_05600 [Oligoflexales bacterium]|nr:hypothetical protein [Oligoflexales bacterium]